MIIVAKGKAVLLMRGSLVRDDSIRHGDGHIIFHQYEKKYMSAIDRVWHKYDELMEDPDCGSMRPHKILAAAQKILDAR